MAVAKWGAYMEPICWSRVLRGVGMQSSDPSVLIDVPTHHSPECDIYPPKAPGAGPTHTKLEQLVSHWRPDTVQGTSSKQRAAIFPPSGPGSPSLKWRKTYKKKADQGRVWITGSHNEAFKPRKLQPTYQDSRRGADASALCHPPRESAKSLGPACADI